MRRVIFLLLRLTGVPFVLRELVQRAKVTILCYHDPTPDVMDRHIRWLSRHYSLISLRQYVDYRNGRPRAKLPRRALVITLDDGHRNNYRLKTIFEHNKIPVTIFLCSAIVGTNRHYWWTVLRDRRNREYVKKVSDSERRLFLAREGFEETKEYLDRQALARHEVLSLKDIIDFQAHTRFHPILPQCSAERAEREMRVSKSELEDSFSLDVYAVAYPNGDYSDREVRLAKDSGYGCALTLDGGYNTDSTDLYRLRRIPIDDSADSNELIVKASGLWGFLETILGRNRYGYRTMFSGDEAGSHAVRGAEDG
jgi:peptidoglycan/xylan/chitin deacetylase (PgdA/CDA1 family)